MDGKYMVNEKYSFKLSNYARDLIYMSLNEPLPLLFLLFLLLLLLYLIKHSIIKQYFKKDRREYTNHA